MVILKQADQSWLFAFDLTSPSNSRPFLGDHHPQQLCR